MQFGMEKRLSFRSSLQARTILLVFEIFTCVYVFAKGVVARSLARWTPDREVWARAMAEDIVLCSCARHLTLKCLSLARCINGSGELLGQPDSDGTNIPSTRNNTA